MSDNKEREWLPLALIKTTAEYLAGKGVPSPRLDAEVLLCSVLDCSRIKLYTIFDSPLNNEQLSVYREFVRRRASREPVSRILGKREFMGLEFIVTPAVLSPRPETEILVEKAISLLKTTPRKKRSDQFFEKWDKKNIEMLKEQIAQNKDIEVPAEIATLLASSECDAANNELVEISDSIEIKSVLDLGTGSGCIPISIVKHCDNVDAVGVDISLDALDVAMRNAESLNVHGRVHFIESDFFSALDPAIDFDIIISNPPYLVRGDSDIWPEVLGYDPELALYACGNGLDCYRNIISSAKQYLAPKGWLLLELGAGQADAVSAMITGSYPEAVIERIPDHSGVERVLAVTSIV